MILSDYDSDDETLLERNGKPTLCSNCPANF